MQVDKDLLNKILTTLAEEYPGTMSLDAFNRVCEGQEDIRKVAGHFQYLMEQGYIDTEVLVDYDYTPRTYQVNIYKTRIYSSGIDFLSEGGYK